MLQTTPVNWRLFGVNSATNSSPVHKYGGSIMGCSSGRCYVQWATVVPLQTSPMSSSLLARSRQLVRNSVVSEQTNEEQPLHASDSTPASGADMARKLVPNAKAIKVNAHMRVQHSLGVDFGDARTGIATSFRGFAPTPLSVCKLRGDKLVGHLLEVASKQKADEFIVGLPQSWDGKETDRSNKTRSFAGRLAQHAADRSTDFPPGHVMVVVTLARPAALSSLSLQSYLILC